MDIIVDLSKDRSKEGKLTIGGQTFRCLGESDLEAAIAHGNPTRDPLKAYGDIPVGSYAMFMQYATPRTESSLRSYGPGPIFLLYPNAGSAILAKRSGLALHGGPVGAPMPPNALRPTHGCIRVDDATIQVLKNKYPFGQLIVQETLGIPT